MSDKTSKVVYKQTARIRTMGSYQALKGRKLALRTAEEQLKVAPQPMKRVTQRIRRQPSPDSTSSEEPPEDDPEDDPDNDFGTRPLRRKVEDESDDDSEAEYQQDRADESDEEELGDQDRRSPDCSEPYWMNHSSCERDDIATDDGDDSNL